MSERSHTLLCWHAERAGLEVLQRAITALRNRRVGIGRVIYLVQEGREPDVPETVKGAAVEPVALPLGDPTVHSAIYPLIKERVLPLARTGDGDLHINISPGTPAMHAVWLVLRSKNSAERPGSSRDQTGSRRPRNRTVSGG